jgi:F0F1-type ATP synthase membrane subunit c/vacuolar-type H+-ATPase subunit K
MFGTVVLAAPTYTTVASTTYIDEEVQDGDIISYNPETSTYRRSQTFADEMMYGVVVRDPVLHLQDREASATGTPVVRYGEVLMNVSTLGGSIYAGDLITSSVLPGIGQRVGREEGAYVLGFALEDMVLTGERIEMENGTTAELGKVSVALRIGPYVTREGAAFLASTSVSGIQLPERAEGQGGFDYFKMFRYVLASLVAVSAVVVASRRFGDTFSQSVISIGRNPLAQSHIRSMVLWNAFLIFTICAVGFGIAAAIIFVP